MGLCCEFVHAKEDTSDYFSAGIYGGAYFGSGLIKDKNGPNSIAAEIEYFKFSDLSFYVQGLYEFTRSNKREISTGTSTREIVLTQKTYRVNISLGGRYYLRNKNVNPFMQLGINHEIRHMGRYRDRNSGNRSTILITGSTYDHELNLNVGAGLSFKLNHKFKIELKYDLYKSLTSSEFSGYSLLAGVKYNFNL